MELKDLDKDLLGEPTSEWVTKLVRGEVNGSRNEWEKLFMIYNREVPGGRLGVHCRPCYMKAWLWYLKQLDED